MHGICTPSRRLGLAARELPSLYAVVLGIGFVGHFHVVQAGLTPWQPTAWRGVPLSSSWLPSEWFSREACVS